MRKWNPAEIEPTPGARVRIKGIELLGDEDLGDQPFQGTARWDGHLWLSTNAGYFPPERFQVTAWREEGEGEETLDWHVGGSAADGSRLDTAPRKAFFYWRIGGTSARHEAYTEPELVAEIRRRDSQAEDTPDEFREALEWLRKPR